MRLRRHESESPSHGPVYRIQTAGADRQKMSKFSFILAMSYILEHPHRTIRTNVVFCESIHTVTADLNLFLQRRIALTDSHSARKKCCEACVPTPRCREYNIPQFVRWGYERLRLSGGYENSTDSEQEFSCETSDAQNIAMIRILLNINTTARKLHAMLDSTDQASQAFYVPDESEGDSEGIKISPSRPGRRAIPISSRAAGIKATWRGCAADAVRQCAAILCARASSAIRAEARAQDAAAIHRVLYPAAPPIPVKLAEFRRQRRHRALEALEDGVGWLDAWFRIADTRGAVPRLFAQSASHTGSPQHDAVGSNRAAAASPAKRRRQLTTARTMSAAAAAVRAEDPAAWERRMARLRRLVARLRLATLTDSEAPPQFGRSSSEAPLQSGVAPAPRSAAVALNAAAAAPAAAATAAPACVSWQQVLPAPWQPPAADGSAPAARAPPDGWVGWDSSGRPGREEGSAFVVGSSDSTLSRDRWVPPGAGPAESSDAPLAAAAAAAELEAEEAARRGWRSRAQQEAEEEASAAAAAAAAGEWAWPPPEVPGEGRAEARARRVNSVLVSLNRSARPPRPSGPARLPSCLRDPCREGGRER